MMFHLFNVDLRVGVTDQDVDFLLVMLFHVSVLHIRMYMFLLVMLFHVSVLHIRM